MRPVALILLCIFNSHLLLAQSDCKDFESYEASQKWIVETDDLPVDKRKEEILKRIICEQQWEDQQHSKLTPVLEGIMLASWPTKRNELLEFIDANNLTLLKSICEANIYPQRCNLGFLIISGTEKPIYSKIASLDITKIKRNKKNIVLELSAKERTQVSITMEALEANDDNPIVRDVILKKGNNRIALPSGSAVKLVEVKNNDGRILIIK